MTDVTIKTKPDPYDDWVTVQAGPKSWWVGKKNIMWAETPRLRPAFGVLVITLPQANNQQVNVMQFDEAEDGEVELAPFQAAGAKALLGRGDARTFIQLIEQFEMQKRAAASGIALVGANGAPKARG